jgi:Coenzyme PQQ synthesis protein D (PqqD)
MVVYRRKSSVVDENFGDETVIVNLETGCYFSVQGSGGVIWNSIVAGLSRSEIIDKVSKLYSGDSNAICAHTAGFIDRLCDESLIEHSNESTGPLSDDPHYDHTGPFVAPSLQKYTDMEEMLQLDPIHEVDEMGWPQAKNQSA